MKPVLAWSRVARHEIEAAFAWYEEMAPGVGWQFADEVASALGLILAEPKAFPAVHLEFRKFVLRRFPYVLIYRADSKRIIIHAVFHAKRNPRQWRERATH